MRSDGEQPFLVALFFDAATDAYIRALAERVLGRSTPCRPHVTLLRIENAGRREVSDHIAEFCAGTGPPRIAFSHLDWFPDRRFLALMPTVTPDLLRFHRRLCERSFAPGRIAASSVYASGRWQPHCTMGHDVQDNLPCPMAIDVPELLSPVGTAVEVMPYVSAERVWQRPTPDGEHQREGCFGGNDTPLP